jgi:hypothetical protein
VNIVLSYILGSLTNIVFDICDSYMFEVNKKNNTVVFSEGKNWEKFYCEERDQTK